LIDYFTQSREDAKKKPQSKTLRLALICSMIRRAGGGMTSRTMADEKACLPPVAPATAYRASQEVSPTPIERLNESRINPVRSERVKNWIDHYN
jgi:hypothetical protein